MSFGTFFSENLFTFLFLFAVIGALIKIELKNAGDKTPTISPLKIAQLTNAGALLWDIRSESAFKAGHIGTAENRPADSIDPAHLKIPKEQAIVLYDENGFNVQATADKLKNAGYTAVQVLDGGFNGWLQENLPVNK